MGYEQSIHVIDTHTAGQATRIVVGGLPILRGQTMMEKKEYFKTNFDHLRKMLMNEPRGHADMFGAVLTEPTDERADYGMIFLDGLGCLNMCGHGTIGVATALVETKMVKVTEPLTTIVLESPAGLIQVDVEVKNGKAVNATFQNVASFLYKEAVPVEVPGLGTVPCDISFGGNFFALVKAEDIQVDIEPENVREIIPKALRIMESINQQVTIQHPDLDITTVDLVEIYGEAKSEAADKQNVVVLGEGEVDRSPCGTGTCAKIAALTAKGELELNQEFVYESILRTKFVAKAVEKTTIGSYQGIIPRITGSAYITGFNHFVLDAADPLEYGFTF